MSRVSTRGRFRRCCTRSDRKIKIQCGCFEGGNEPRLLREEEAEEEEEKTMQAAEAEEVAEAIPYFL